VGFTRIRPNACIFSPQPFEKPFKLAIFDTEALRSANGRAPQNQAGRGFQVIVQAFADAFAWLLPRLLP
jgi:hypothetical protein